MASNRPTYVNVPPIERGYPITIPITYSADYVAAYPLTGRFVASFRGAVASPTELFQADSADTPPTIAVSGLTLQITIPGSATAGFPLGTVVFDVVNATTQTPIPGWITYPVVDAVTRGVS